MSEEAKTTLTTPRLRLSEFRKERSWDARPLGDLVRFSSGGTPSKDEANYWNGDIPWISGSSMYDIKITTSEHRVTALAIGNGTRIAEKGSLLVLVRGSMLFNRVPIGIAAIDVAFNQDVKALTLGDGVNAAFLLNQLLAISPRIPITETGIGAGKIETDTLANLTIYLPSLQEQQQIADGLTSLDEVIAAQGRKLAALAAHKRGLMQQVFPRDGETLPNLRFPEFRDMPEWAVEPLGDIFETKTGGTPDRATKAYWGGTIPWITTSLVDFNVIDKAEEFITEAGLDDSSAKLFPKNTVLVALYGQGKTRGKVALLGIEATTNQACGAILPGKLVNPVFTFLSLSGRYDELRALSNSGGQENLSQGLVRDLPFRYPKDKAEQEGIADCLSALAARIAAESQKLDALKTHKKGLLQQLFPSPEGD